MYRLVFLFVALAATTTHASPRAKAGNAKPRGVAKATTAKAKATRQIAPKAQLRAARNLPPGFVEAKTPNRLADAKGSSNNSMALDPSSSDPQITVQVGSNNSLIIRGTGHGPTDMLDIYGAIGPYRKGVLASGVSVWVDAAKASPGRERNRRQFLVYTRPGTTSEEVARSIASKANGAGDFKATVDVIEGGARVTFAPARQAQAKAPGAANLMTAYAELAYKMSPWGIAMQMWTGRN